MHIHALVTQDFGQMERFVVVSGTLQKYYGNLQLKLVIFGYFPISIVVLPICSDKG